MTAGLERAGGQGLSVSHVGLATALTEWPSGGRPQSRWSRGLRSAHPIRSDWLCSHPWLAVQRTPTLKNSCLHVGEGLLQIA